MTKTVEQQVADTIEKLASFGIEAFVDNAFFENHPDDLKREIRVPALERPNGWLSLPKFNAFVHSQLAGQREKGWLMSDPETGIPLDVFCYDPDFEGDLTADEVLNWSVPTTGLESFDWRDLVLGDESAWVEGWEYPHHEPVSEGLYFLTSLSQGKIIDLPALPLLTYEGLIQHLASTGGAPREIRCFSWAINNTGRVVLRLAEDGQLQVIALGTGERITITPDHIDSKGQLVVHGAVILTHASL